MPKVDFSIGGHPARVVVIIDTGGRLGISLEGLRDPLMAHVPDMAKIHPSRSDWNAVMVDDHTVVGTYTDTTEGKQTPGKIRLTVFPPLGYALEALEGPLSGSKFFHYFEASRDHAETTVVGDFQSSVIPAGQLEKAARDFLESEWEEDQAYLSKKT